MSINARELRIGNYIQKYHSPQDCCIDIVDADVFSTISEDGEISAEPIPLTEDWLLRMGFVKSAGMLYLNLTGEIELYTNNGIFGIDIDGQCLGLPHILYVHSLQNLAHSLTGEELTIKE